MDQFWLIIAIAVLTGFITVGLIGLHYRRQHQSGAWPTTDNPLLVIIRPLIGWPLILVGIVLTPLPIPFGIIMITAGAVIIGTRSPIIRYGYFYVRRLLRLLAYTRLPVLGTVGRFLLDKQKQVARVSRRRNLDRIEVPVQVTQQSREEASAHHYLEPATAEASERAHQHDHSV